MIYIYMSFFFFYKIREEEGGIDPALGGWYQWERGEMGKGCRRVNMLQI
jgi:hypothetical protein